MRHWLITSGYLEGRTSVEHDEATARHAADRGFRVRGPYVLEAERSDMHARIVEVAKVMEGYRGSEIASTAKLHRYARQLREALECPE